jgi:hypothetical protein
LTATHIAQPKESEMRLFSSDLTRNLGIGFAIGTAIAVWQMAPQGDAGLVSQAHAAPVVATR